MAKLEAVIAARQQEEEEARLKREQDKEMAVRSQQKEKVDCPQHIHHKEFLLPAELDFITKVVKNNPIIKKQVS